MADGGSLLAQQVAQAGRELVQRAREGFTAEPVDPPLTLVTALDLGAGRHVAVVADGAGRRWTVPVVVTAARARRATAGDGVAQALVELLARPQGPAPDGFRLVRWYGAAASGERAVTADQTNESVVVGERAVVKWALRQPAAGDDVRHPAPERLGALVAGGFTGTARPWGVLTADVPGGTEPLLLATVTEYLPGARDGWDWAVADLRAHARGDLDEAAALIPVAVLGDLVAGLHAALATAGRGALTGPEAQQWHARARADLAEAVARVDGPEGERLTARAPRIAAGLAPLAHAAGSPTIDVHGDLHVGQVLRRPGADGPAYAVVDFDGNPVVAAAERARRLPAAVDVAGMLASLDHVGRVVLRRTEGVDAAVVTRWTARAERVFLDRYRAGLARHGLSDLLDERLLRPVRLQQECREFHYAVQHLPHWRYVPDGALGALLDAPDGPDAPDEPGAHRS
ncbi:hypothetical protein [Kineosporia sp. A_224]|uniref:hypothetical protein n=1 Tax=Kineosporia sp. A_224 TaxID=1962180 RepID=UPI0018E91203|nr:hypothetical protein [Kineosporia sp. A_224]